jgi:hypothetical protein
MSRQFTIQLHQDAAAYIDRAMQVADKNGVHLAGDYNRGKFSGNGLVGHYSVINQVMTVTILRKPILAPWSIVERKLYEFFTARAA